MIQIFVKDEIYQQRISQCNSCEKFNSLKLCTECNCFMLIKARLPHKSCPIGLWQSAGEEDTIEEEIDDKYSFRRPDVSKEDLVKLYGSNKKFYSINGIKTKEEVETDVTIPHALIYFGDSTIVAVDEDFTAPNWINL